MTMIVLFNSYLFILYLSFIIFKIKQNLVIDYSCHFINCTLIEKSPSPKGFLISPFRYAILNIIYNLYMFAFCNRYYRISIFFSFPLCTHLFINFSRLPFSRLNLTLSSHWVNSMFNLPAPFDGPIFIVAEVSCNDVAVLVDDCEYNHVSNQSVAYWEAKRKDVLQDFCNWWHSLFISALLIKWYLLFVTLTCDEQLQTWIILGY